MLELLASEYRPFIQDIFGLSLFVAAWLWGGGPERAIAASWMVFFEGLPRLYKGYYGASYQLEQVDLFYASMDGAACVLWIAIALNANRNYPLIIAAMQILALAAHLARGLIETISPIAYATMVIAPGWIQLCVLAVGLFRHVMRKKQYGPYRDWRVPVRWFGLLQAREGQA